MTELEQKIEEAKKLLNENEYVVIPITKGQMCLCDICNENVRMCRYNAVGHACTNLQCLNTYIQEQIDYKTIISNIE